MNSKIIWSDVSALITERADIYYQVEYAPHSHEPGDEWVPLDGHDRFSYGSAVAAATKFSSRGFDVFGYPLKGVRIREHTA